MAEPASLITRLRWLGRALAVLSLLFGAAFVVLARRSAGEAGGIASALFWVAAVLQFACVFVLLWRGRRG
jgi:Zn-dependent protease with chaperone function